jgi:hypothetical protein
MAMTPLQLAEVHQHDQTGSLPIVSRALLECEARAKRLEDALRDLLDAGDNSVTADDDVAAMLKFGEATEQARAAIAAEQTADCGGK